MVISVTPFDGSYRRCPSAHGQTRNTTNSLHARLASTTMPQQTHQHEDMRSAASSQSRVSTPVSWTVTRSPAQGTRRMILVYQIGIAHRVSLQGVKLAKSGSQYEFSAADPRTCRCMPYQCLRITRSRKCAPSASAGCRPGRYSRPNVCTVYRCLVVCARYLQSTSLGLVHWTGAQSARAGTDDVYF